MRRFYTGTADPTGLALTSLVRQCGTPEQAKRLQHYVDRHGYSGDTTLQNLLLQMHGKFGELDTVAARFRCLFPKNEFSWNIAMAANAQNGHLQSASEFFRKMPCHDGVSWNTILAAQGKSRNAFKVFHSMCLEGVPPGYITLANLLDVSASLEALGDGKLLHSVSMECELDVIVGNSLINMYSKCRCVDEAKSIFDRMSTRSIVVWTVMVATFAQNGHLLQARNVFDKTPQRTIITWNAMITGYSRDGKAAKALELYQEMNQVQKISPDKITFAAAVTSCTTLGDLEQGKLIHEQIENSVFCNDPHIQARLVSMYISCHKIDSAEKVYMSAVGKETILVTAMIAAYARAGHLEQANKLLQETLPKLDVVQCNIIITAFAQKGYVRQAQDLFDDMQIHDHASWNSLIAAYSDNGHCVQALEVFNRMDLEGLKPGSITWVHVLEACSQLQTSSTTGMVFLNEIRSFKALQSDVLVQTAIVNMFGKRGALLEARQMFDSMQTRNMVSWNAMITAYAQAGQGREALKIFREMDLEGVEPSKVTYIGILDACADLGFLQAGKEIITGIEVSLCVCEPVLSTAVVNMYSKCGMVSPARDLFDKTIEKDVISWCAIMAAYAQNGHHLEAVELFHTMSLEGMAPNETTFVLVLWASSHAGLLSLGMTHFLSMETDYGVVPSGNHYACMIDVLGRLGHLMEAHELLESMPFEPSRVERTSLLSACRMHGSRSELKPRSPVEYVLLSSVFNDSSTNSESVLNCS